MSAKKDGDSRWVMKEIARLKAALHREGANYVCEPDPPGMWRPTAQEVTAAANWLESQ